MRTQRDRVCLIYTGQFFQVFVYLWPIIWFLFPHLTCPRTLPNMGVPLFPRWIPAQIPMGGPLASHIMGWCPLLFDAQGAFLCMCSVPSPRMGNIWPLDPLLKQGLAPLCSCHDCYLKVSSEDKAWLFTLFLLLLLFRSVNKRLVVNI